MAPPGVPDLDATTDTGVSSTDNVTQTRTALFVGTGTNGLTVTLLADGVAVGSGTVANGQYRITSTALAEGVRSLTATQGTALATSNPSAALQVTVDTTAPVVKVPTVRKQTSSARGRVDGTAGLLTGDQRPITLVFSPPNGASTTLVVQRGASSSARFTLTLGTLCILTVSQSDLAGSTGTNSATFQN